MADQKQKTEDVFLKDDSAQNLASTLTDLKSMFTSLQAEVQALKTSSQTQDKTLGTDKFMEQIRDDVGGAEAKTADLVLASSKQSARDYDNAKMNQADEKDFALTTKFDGLKFGKQILQQDQQIFSDLREKKDALFNAYLTHFSSMLSSERTNRDNTLSDERVQKDAIRTPEAQGGTAQGK